MNTELSDVEKRVTRYWFSDGLAELSGGAMLLLIGIYFASQEWLPRGSAARAILEASLALLLIGGALLTRKVVNAMKFRLTYPRTGYVEYRSSGKNTSVRRWLTAGIAAAVSILLVLWGRLVSSFEWLTAFTGLVFGLVFILLRARASGLGRFYLLGAFSALLGIGLSLSGLAMGFSLGLLYGLTGLVSMVSGAIVLSRYLHDNPLPREG
jgi:hypothetical protein